MAGSLVSLGYGTGVHWGQARSHWRMMPCFKQVGFLCPFFWANQHKGKELLMHSVKRHVLLRSS